MSDVPIQDADDAHKAALAAWREACTINGDMFVAPFNGICWSCKGNMVEHHINTGVAVPTGCPLCHRSFVE